MHRGQGRSSQPAVGTDDSRWRRAQRQRLRRMTQRGRASIVAAVVLAFAAGVWLAGGSLSDGLVPPPAVAAPPPALEPPPLPPPRAVLERLPVSQGALKDALFC